MTLFFLFAYLPALKRDTTDDGDHSECPGRCLGPKGESYVASGDAEIMNTIIDGVNELDLNALGLSGLQPDRQESPLFERVDFETIQKGDIGMWAMRFRVDDYEESLATVGPTMLEHIATEVYLNIRVRASKIMPTHRMERMLLVDYTPWRRVDPPIPIPLWLPRTPATELHYRAISAFLGKHPNAGRLMLQATSDVIKAAIDSWTQLEVFYYWVKMRSLLAGTHKQNYRLYGRLEALPPPRSR